MIELIKKFWFIVLVGVLLIAGISYFAYEDNKNKVAGKQENGKDVVYSVLDKNITADDFYAKIYDTLGTANVYQFLAREVVAQSYETTDVMKENAKTSAENVIEQFKTNYGEEYESYLNQALASLGYSSKDDLQEYFINYEKTTTMLAEYITAHQEDFYADFAEELKPRGISHILVKFEDSENPSENPTEAEQKKMDEIDAMLNEGKDFGEVAYEKSEDTGSAVSKGSIGLTTTQSQLVEAFLKTSLELEAGEVSGWVKSEYGYHKIKCDATDFETLMAKYKEYMIEAIVNFDPTIQTKAIWKKAESLNISFGNDEIKQELMKYMQIEDGGAQ